MKSSLIFFGQALLLITISLCSPKLQPTAGAQDTINADISKETHDGLGKEKNNPAGFTGIVNRDIIYGHNINRSGNDEQLGMDIYQPANAEGKKFPVVLFIHGGGFKAGDKTGMSAPCKALAQNGYIAVSINYRLGRGQESQKTACSDDTLQLKEAIYRATQDAHAALRYLAAHADEYSIDKDWIFIGGSSAGAITALLTAYLSQQDAEIFMPGFSATLGPLHAGGNDIKETYKLRGVISMWGAFVDPALINVSTALPTIFFQGEKDKAVPFNTGHLTPCPNTTVAYGTYPLYNRLKELGVTTIAHVDPNGGHGVYSLQFRIANILCFLNNVRTGNKKQLYLVGEQSSCN